MTKQQIENTKAFKELDKVTQTIYRKKAIMDEVKRELQIAKEIGIEKYNDVYNPRPYKLKVIKELLDNEY